jgi:hypothetical protein
MSNIIPFDLYANTGLFNNIDEKSDVENLIIISKEDLYDIMNKAKYNEKQKSHLIEKTKILKDFIDSFVDQLVNSDIM